MLDALLTQRHGGRVKLAALLTWTLVVLALGSRPATAQEVVPVTNILTLSTEGKVEGARKVATGEVAASVILSGIGTARLQPHTEISLPDASEKEHSLRLLKGRLFLNISAEDLKKRAGGEFRLKTPAALLAVKGTEFFVESATGRDTIGVQQGVVSVQDSAQHPAIDVQAGQAIEMGPQGGEPVRALKPEEQGTAPYPAPATDPSIIQGKILDIAGKPLAGVSVVLRTRGVRAAKPGMPGGTYVYHTEGEATTDADGRFVFKKADKIGHYTIAAGGPKKLKLKNDVVLPVPSTFNHGTLDELVGVTRELIASGEVMPEIIMILSPLRVLSIALAYQPNGTQDFKNVSSGHKLTVKVYSNNTTVNFNRLGDIGSHTGKSLSGTYSGAAANDPVIAFSHSQLGLEVQNKGAPKDDYSLFDAGVAPLDSITEAPKDGYAADKIPCIEGHVYVARFLGGKCAKFKIVGLEDVSRSAK